MRFKSYIPALYVLTTQLDSLSKPSRPHKIMNIFFAAIIVIIRRAFPPRPSQAQDFGGRAFRYIFFVVLRQAQHGQKRMSLQSLTQMRTIKNRHSELVSESPHKEPEKN